MAQSAQHIVIGVFADRTAAGQAIKDLQQAGFHDEQLGFATRHEAFNNLHTHASGPNALLRGIVGGVLGAVDLLLLATIGPADASSMLSAALPITEGAIDRSEDARAPHTSTQEVPTTESTEDQSNATQATEDEERADIIAGGATGSILGAIAGTAAALLIPGIGPAIAGGVLVTALGSAAIGGIAGGFLGAFTHLGIPREQAHYYEREFKSGRTLVTVHTERPQEALDLLRTHGALHAQTY